MVDIDAGAAGGAAVVDVGGAAVVAVVAVDCTVVGVVAVDCTVVGVVAGGDVVTTPGAVEARNGASDAWPDDASDPYERARKLKRCDHHGRANEADDNAATASSATTPAARRET